MEFIEAPAFNRYLTDYLSDDGYRELQAEITRNPECGDVTSGTGGFRKMRWADARRAKGRRGGLRLIYYYFKTDQQVWLMAIYNKDEASNLTAKEKGALRAAIERELKARATRRTQHHGRPKRG